MTGFFLFVLFIFGLLIGSFLNAVIWRLHTEESPLKGRSYCPHCKHQLAWFDLVPLLSFLALRGKCRYCGKPISFQYPLVELGTACVFVLLALSQGVSSLMMFSVFPVFQFILLLIVAAAFIVIFVYDLKYFLIPDVVLVPAITAAALYQIIGAFMSHDIAGLLLSIVAASGAAAFFFALFFVSNGTWMGFGDGKLAFLLGLLLSWPLTFIALFLAFVAGAIIGVLLIAFKKKGMKSEMPFAPFLVLGALMTLWIGTTLEAWLFLY